MVKHKWIFASLSAFAVWALILLSLPQGVSADASELLQAGTASATFTPSPTPIQLIVEVPRGKLRNAPGLTSAVSGIVLENTRLTVMGLAYYGDSVWYLVQIEGSEQAWISEAIVSIAADLEVVPTINLTEYFERTTTPTWTPGGPTATATIPRSSRTPTATRTPAETANYPATATAGAANPQPTATKRPPTNVPTVRPPTSTSVSQPTTVRTATRTPVPQPTQVPPESTFHPQPPTNTSTSLPPPTSAPVQPTNRPPMATAPPLPTNVPPPTDPPQPSPTNAAPPTSVPPTNPPPPTAVPPTNPPPPTYVGPPTAASGN